MRRAWLIASFFVISAAGRSQSASQKAEDPATALQVQLRTADSSLDGKKFTNLKEFLDDREFIVPVDEFIRARLNENVSPSTLGSELNRSLRLGLRRSWSEQPAYVLPCCTGSSILVAFTVGRGTASRTVLEVYTAEKGRYRRVLKTTHGLDGLDLHIAPLGKASAHRLFLVYGPILGANDSISRAYLYRISGGAITPVWRMRRTLALSVRVDGNAVEMDYTDGDRYFRLRRPPFEFRDTYVYSGGRFLRTRHQPIPESSEASPVRRP